MAEVDLSTDLLVKIGVLEEKVKIKEQSVEQPTNTDNTISEDNTLNACLQITPRRIRCTECHRFSAETEEKMLRHIRKVHRGENPFQCYMCDYSTYNKVGFEEHVRLHQGIKPYSCSRCSYRSVSKKNLKKHELIHRPDNPLKCPHCDYLAKHPKAFNCHIQSHNDDKDLIKCNHCKYRCSSEAALKNHMQTHKSVCKVCFFEADSKPLLKKHMLKEHNIINEKEPLFTCSHCKWSSNHKPKILLHLVHHPNQYVDESVDTTILKTFGII